MAETKKGSVTQEAAKSAFRGGLSGAAAQTVNVLGLMWLRTTMNVQMARGGSMRGTARELWREGGVPRFYRGLLPALFQSPVSRFGDTFANAGIMALTDSNPATRDLPIFAKTAMASATAGAMRVLLMPIDAWKTNKQVHGADGLGTLREKARLYPGRGPANLWGWSALWHGGLAQASATAVGHWPWFVTYNYLNAYLPWDDKDTPFVQRTARNASIGLCASAISDTCSNSIRVLKTYKQTSPKTIGYGEAFWDIRRQHGLFGWNGLFFRGLQTRIVASGLNSIVFTVGWKTVQRHLENKQQQQKQEDRQDQHQQHPVAEIDGGIKGTGE